MILVALGAGCPRAGGPATLGDAREVSALLDGYRRELLEPARVPPASIPFEAREVRDGSVVGTARPLRAEDAPWNQAEDGGPLLFNNRVAHLFEVRVEGPPPLRWLPAETRVELNDADTVVAAAGNSEPLLGQLLYHAVIEERFAVDGDLVARTRAAGPFRSSYLPSTSDSGVLEGILGFPLYGEQGRLLSDKHVVAMRLTIAVEADGERHDLVFVFE